MLSTRIVMGAILAALAGAMLLADRWFAPHYPFLFLTILLLAGLGTRELLQLLPNRLRPLPVFCYAGVLLLNASHWMPSGVWIKYHLSGEADFFALMLHLFAVLV